MIRILDFSPIPEPWAEQEYKPANPWLIRALRIAVVLGSLGFWYCVVRAVVAVMT